MGYPKLTWYFSELIPDYETWDSVISSEGFTRDTVVDTLFFTSLLRKYSKSQVRYGNPELFFEELRLVYFNVYNKYNCIYMTTKKLEGLNNDEILKLGELIQNVAYKPAQPLSSPDEIINYINEQKRNYTVGSKLERYLTYIANIPTLRIEEFVSEFRYMFIQALPTVETLIKRY